MRKGAEPGNDDLGPCNLILKRHSNDRPNLIIRPVGKFPPFDLYWRGKFHELFCHLERLFNVNHIVNNLYMSTVFSVILQKTQATGEDDHSQAGG
jgi:hypothetical protein